MSLENRYLNFDQVMEILDKKIDEVTALPPIIDIDKIIDGVRNLTIMNFLTKINPLKVCVSTQTEFVYPIDKPLESPQEPSKTCDIDGYPTYDDQDQWMLKTQEERKKQLDNELDDYFSSRIKKESKEKELRRSKRLLSKQTLNK